MTAWDEKKRRQVIKDHRIDFRKIDDAIDDPYAIYIEDFDHNDTEERWKLNCKVIRIRPDLHRYNL